MTNGIAIQSKQTSHDNNIVIIGSEYTTHHDNNINIDTYEIIFKLAENTLYHEALYAIITYIGTYAINE